MIETLLSPPAPPTARMLTDLTEAYAAGDVTLGEQLLMQALDDDLPWDEVCSAAARGIARRYDERRSG
jgi:hypothetical protein